MDEHNSETDSQPKPKKGLKKLGTAPVLSVSKSVNPGIKPKSKESKAGPSPGSGIWCVLLLVLASLLIIKIISL